MDLLPELLAPAGGPDQFNAALAAGADAIYCGFGNTFNARRGAQSFTSETFGEACRKAHLAGVRVYVTVNVVIRDDELPSVLALMRRAWLLGADAFIIQDWGLLCEVRKRWPQMECHLSTQANVHDARAVAWCRDLGVERVTLSRELSLPEIERIAKEGVELECFGHGAICFCYSGVCCLSSCGGSRSANRGMCAQPCRLPYTLVDENGSVLSPPGRGRPLCPKDFYSFDDLGTLAHAGVGALKIEGRLKGADYVYAVTAAYRAQLDDLACGHAPSRERLETRRTQLKRAFNRDFTNAYLHGSSGDELMSYERSNNRGELVGTVVGSRSFGSVKVRRGGRLGGRDRLRTTTVAEVSIALDRPVGKQDLLEVRPLSDPSQFLTTHVQDDAPAGSVVTCKTTRPMERGSLVRVIRSQSAMHAGERAASLEIPRKRAVHVVVTARRGEPFCVEVKTVDGAVSGVARGFVVEAAKTRAVTKEDLVEHVGRMGASPFEPMSFEVSLDEGCGMSFSAVHRVRQEACDALEVALLEPYAMREASSAPSRETLLADLERRRNRIARCEQAGVVQDSVEVCALAGSADTAWAALDAGATRLYATPEALDVGIWPEGVVPLLDEVCRQRDHARLDAWVQTGTSVAVGNVSELVLARERGAAPEIRSCIPVHNEACLLALEQAGAAGLWCSPELSLEEIGLVAAHSLVPVGLLVFGRTRAMTSEHCVLQVADKCVHDCARCDLRKQKLSIRGEAGELYPVRTDLQGRSRIYAARSLDLTPHVGEIVAAGVSRLAADCTLLSPEETRAAVERVARAVRAYQEAKRPDVRMAGAVTGHLFEPIQ